MIKNYHILLLLLFLFFTIVFVFILDIVVEPDFFCCLFQFFKFRNSLYIIPMIFASSAYSVSQYVGMLAHLAVRFPLQLPKRQFCLQVENLIVFLGVILYLSSAQFYDNGKIRGSKEDSRFQVVNNLCWYSSSLVLSGDMRSCCCALLLVTIT